MGSSPSKSIRSRANKYLPVDETLNSSSAGDKQRKKGNFSYDDVTPDSDTLDEDLSRFSSSSGLEYNCTQAPPSGRNPNTSHTRMPSSGVYCGDNGQNGGTPPSARNDQTLLTSTGDGYNQLGPNGVPPGGDTYSYVGFNPAGVNSEDDYTPVERHRPRDLVTSIDKLHLSLYKGLPSNEPAGSKSGN